MTADLVQFLRDRLDEDEQAARGTGMPPDWHQGPGDDPEWTSEEMVLMWPPEHHTPYEQDKHWRGLTVDPAGLAAHIARHDPARILRKVDAKRRILDDYEQAELTIRVAKQAPGTPPYDIMTGATNTLRRMLRLLALPYADHPDYLPAWRP